MNHKHEALWPVKNYNLYILCTLILSNLHYEKIKVFTIGFWSCSGHLQLHIFLHF